MLLRDHPICIGCHLLKEKKIAQKYVDAEWDLVRSPKGTDRSPKDIWEARLRNGVKMQADVYGLDAKVGREGRWREESRRVDYFQLLVFGQLFKLCLIVRSVLRIDAADAETSASTTKTTFPFCGDASRQHGENKRVALLLSTLAFYGVPSSLGSISIPEDYITRDTSNRDRDHCVSLPLSRSHCSIFQGPRLIIIFVMKIYVDVGASP